MDKINFSDILADWAKVGTMLVVSRLISGESIQDQDWIRASLFTLVGFTMYHVLTRNVVDTERFGEYKPIADDWMKVGTMMVVSRLLSGQSLQDPAWLQASLFTLLGFTAYNLLTSKVIKGENVSQHPAVVATVNDWAKVGTMLVVSRLLAGGSLTDQAWARGGLATLLGFTAYNVVSNLRA